MGSSQSEIEQLMAGPGQGLWFDPEIPQHEVYLDDFWIDRTEVTNAMYVAFLNAYGNWSEGGASWLNTGIGDEPIRLLGGMWIVDSGYDNHPVVEVSWYGARAYCQWAGRRLPSEAEWEMAARGTEGGLYPWGDGSASCNLANHMGCVGDTAEVGAHLDGNSPFGAWDMAGNVWEWVADWFDGSYYSNSPSSNPQGPASGEFRVFRGGGWHHDPVHLRAANRGMGLPESSDSSFGFRCAGGASP